MTKSDFVFGEKKGGSGSGWAPLTEWLGNDPP